MRAGCRSWGVFPDALEVVAGADPGGVGEKDQVDVVCGEEILGHADLLQVGGAAPVVAVDDGGDAMAQQDVAVVVAVDDEGLVDVAASLDDGEAVILGGRWGGGPCTRRPCGRC